MLLMEYIWTDGNGNLRSKTRVCEKGGELRDWNYDGSSTGQASGTSSEVIIKPKRTYDDPWNPKGKLVLCDTYLPNGEPHSTNNRSVAENIFNKENYNNYPLFGIEHEFFVFNNKTHLPVGFEKKCEDEKCEKCIPFQQGQYYCSLGSQNAFGREFLYECLEKSLKAGVKCTGCNLEVCPGQMEIQICNYGIQAGDDSLMLKYILHRVSEKYNYTVDFSAKPVKGDWNGSGCHVNFSTESMRKIGGYEEILKAIEKLRKKHKEHIEIYGDDNKERLTGKHETSDMENFTSGVADRGASIRIPTTTYADKKGYFEDRRPSSSADMYLVTSKIFETCL
jgi:glutamine synthetase